jgi:hypothetical protein
MATGFEGDPEYEALLEKERQNLRARQPMDRSGGTHAVGPTSRELATKVHALGQVVVVVAWVVALLAAVAGLLAAVGLLLPIRRPGGDDFLAALLLFLVPTVLGAVQASFIALVGRYVQMRAAVVLERQPS